MNDLTAEVTATLVVEAGEPVRIAERLESTFAVQSATVERVRPAEEAIDAT